MGDAEMSTTDKILAGIEIILKYEPDADFAAEHEMIFFGSQDGTIMSNEDCDKLQEWGWIVDTQT